VRDQPNLNISYSNDLEEYSCFAKTVLILRLYEVPPFITDTLGDIIDAKKSKC